MENARRIQAAIIENKPVAIYSDAEVKGIIPENFLLIILKVPITALIQIIIL